MSWHHRSASQGYLAPSPTRGRWVAARQTMDQPDRSRSGSIALVAVLALLLTAGLAGLAVDSLAVLRVAAQSDDCPGPLVEVGDTGLCTHGPETEPIGQEAVVTAAGTAPAIDCAGDGSSGNRVQVLYVRPSNVPSRASTLRPQLREIAQLANDIYRNSARETGGYRAIRFVHDADCRIIIDDVAISPSSTLGNDNFFHSISQLQAQGYGRSDRMYMIFMDADVRIVSGSDDTICGIGTYFDDDRDSSNNFNNSGPAFGRIDRGCWNFPDVAAHELMHNLGAVQLSAPNATDYGHCTDEYEIMCYADGPTTPPMREVCSPAYPRDYTLFDCRNNDYFHTNPASGSYLATHWNTADNQFLIARDPRVTLDKEKSKFNGPVVATLTNFAPNSSVTLRWPRAYEITSGPNDGDFTTLLASGMTDGSGRATLTFRTPLEPLGDYKITARDPSGGKAEATLRVIPRIMLNETEGPTSTTLRVYFYGFGPGDRIDVRWHADASASSSYRVLKTITVASNGRASSIVTIPSNTGTGARLVVGKVVGVSRSASTPFEVTVGGASTDGTATPTGTATPVTTPTSEPTETPVAEPTETATPEPVPTETAIPEPTATNTPVPNASPVAAAGEDRIVTDTDGSGDEPVQLDGSGSTDPEGAVLGYAWSVDGTEVATGSAPSLTLSVGTTTVLLTVTDEQGATATDAVSITVVAPPTGGETGVGNGD